MIFIEIWGNVVLCVVYFRYRTFFSEPVKSSIIKHLASNLHQTECCHTTPGRHLLKSFFHIGKILLKKLKSFYDPTFCAHSQTIHHSKSIMDIWELRICNFFWCSASSLFVLLYEFRRNIKEFCYDSVILKTVIHEKRATDRLFAHSGCNKLFMGENVSCFINLLECNRK